MKRHLFAAVCPFLLIMTSLGVLFAAPTTEDQAVQIHLQAAVFDPLARGPASAALSGSVASADDLYLVQFVGPVEEQWKTQVSAAGARLYGYVPDNAFLARIDQAALARIQSLSFVRWIGPYLTDYRIDPNLANAGAALQQTGPITVSVQALPDADSDKLVQQINALGATLLERSDTPRATCLRVMLSPDRLNELSGLASVIWVEPYFEPQLYNDAGGSGIMRIDQVREQLLTGNSIASPSTRMCSAGSAAGPSMSYFKSIRTICRRRRRFISTTSHY